ncbi:hypothetical protein PHLGIDRAFT_455089 [Phlebiopsis gigantea 11061_1 CR5-6]|uniref:Uncharacterized protein n=1 Tax=Phlebiopsis gigantea (strain 11061_1 CR5-6) TaxID=745531 RepID=A0A0C3PUW9_PHLG1|nr:hypothetical protein PHLGIDRAFT_455089 [Phlebiopsis gigantea 11061_1 CR5-6]
MCIAQDIRAIRESAAATTSTSAPFHAQRADRDPLSEHATAPAGHHRTMYGIKPGSLHAYSCIHTLPAEWPFSSLPVSSDLKMSNATAPIPRPSMNDPIAMERYFKAKREVFDYSYTIDDDGHVINVKYNTSSLRGTQPTQDTASCACHKRKELFVVDYYEGPGARCHRCGGLKLPTPTIKNEATIEVTIKKEE